MGLVAALVSLLGYPVYLLDMLGPGHGGWRKRAFDALRLRGGTRPRLVSWVIWTALQAVIFLGARAGGATDTNWLPVAYFLGCLSVGVVAWRLGDRTLGRVDLGFGALAVLSLALLVGAREPRAALILAILTDALAGAPTLWSVWREPRHESLAGWLFFLAGGLLNMLAFPVLQDWTFEVVGYTLVVVAQQGFVVGWILLASRRARTGG